MITIGVIGCGHWGPNYVRNFGALAGVTVRVAADVDQNRRTVVERMFPWVKTAADHRAVLDDPAIDAVVVATPTGTHFGLVKEALEAGKDVLCEKPLTTTAAEALELARLAEEKKRILMVGHTFLFNPGILKLKQLLDEDVAGRVYYLHAERTNLGPIRSDVNVVYDLASHDISIFNFLRGELPGSASAQGGRFLRSTIDDVSFITLRYADGVMASILVSWLHPRKVREVTVVGDKKMIIWNDLGVMGPLMVFDKKVEREPTYLDFGEFHLLTREGDITIPRVNQAEPLRLQCDHFVSCVKERSKPRSPAEQGVGVARVLDAINLSISKGGMPCQVQTE
ncbi:MAG: Gfo/Idh/MocA family oxidoreductase [Candidatus Riflebacteria bacterium]|nr:Gfo/Idh/MocA family oxidoreductase [Candidatus Riflebacteria bacterium]